jgi:hypothetical protein
MRVQQLGFTDLVTGYKQLAQSEDQDLDDSDEKDQSTGDDSNVVARHCPPPFSESIVSRFSMTDERRVRRRSSRETSVLTISSASSRPGALEIGGSATYPVWTGRGFVAGAREAFPAALY